jgi:rod shape-determining protein MreD
VTQRLLLYSVLSLLLIILDSTLMKFLAIAGIMPDILLIWIVYIAVSEGQIAGTTAGFIIGLAMSFLGSSGMIGLPALAKTSAGFLAGYFYNENKILATLGGYQLIAIVVIASVVHNILYFTIFLQGSDFGWFRAMVYYGAPTTLYTAALALLPMFVFARRYHT